MELNNEHFYFVIVPFTYQNNDQEQIVTNF